MNNEEQSNESIIENLEQAGLSRRGFLHGMGGLGAMLGMGGLAGNAGAAETPKDADGKVIPGFEKEPEMIRMRRKAGSRSPTARSGWASPDMVFASSARPSFIRTIPMSKWWPPPISIPGGVPPLPRRWVPKTYPSCEEMIKDKSIEAVFIATDAPSHARLAIMALEHGKHVCSAVPAVFGFEAEDEAEKLFNAVKKSGMKYMMNETSTFHADLYAKRMQYQAGALGKVIYSEGEYYHDDVAPSEATTRRTERLISMDGAWRSPLWYPTHATAYYISMTGRQVHRGVRLGHGQPLPRFLRRQQPAQNPFGTEIAMLKTSEGGISRMAVSWDMKNAHGEQGRVYGQKPHDENRREPARHSRRASAAAAMAVLTGRLTNDFIESILLDRKPIVDW